MKTATGLEQDVTEEVAWPFSDLFITIHIVPAFPASSQAQRHTRNVQLDAVRKVESNRNQRGKKAKVDDTHMRRFFSVMVRWRHDPVVVRIVIAATLS